MEVLPFVGTHGVGKSTLVASLSMHYPIGYGAEVARGVISLFGFRSADDYRAARKEVVEVVQEAILRVQMWKEQIALLSPRLCVWDRSVLDPVAYAAAYGVRGDVVRRWREEAIDHAVKHYPLIFYIPPAIPLEADGFRSTDEELRSQVDRLLVEMLAEAESRGVKIHRISADTFDARVGEVIGAMVDAGLGWAAW